MRRIELTQPCPCGASDVLVDCCDRFHRGTAAPTAEALMRSRYCAFVRHDEGYLLRTWHPDTAPPRVVFDPQQRWLGLKIKAVIDGGVADTAGEVVFAARYKIAGRGHRLEEHSHFVRSQGLWLYVSGS